MWYSISLLKYPHIPFLILRWLLPTLFPASTLLPLGDACMLWPSPSPLPRMVCTSIPSIMLFTTTTPLSDIELTTSLVSLSLHSYFPHSQVDLRPLLARHGWFYKVHNGDGYRTFHSLPFSLRPIFPQPLLTFMSHFFPLFYSASTMPVPSLLTRPSLTWTTLTTSSTPGALLALSSTSSALTSTVRPLTTSKLWLLDVDQVTPPLSLIAVADCWPM